VTTQARLRAFAAVAESGSVRAAAQRLVVTESAVSAAIAALTREIGVPLVERHGRGVGLTPAGQTYASYARTLLGLHAEALSAARGDGDAEHGLVRMAAVTTAGDHVLPGMLASFRDRHPGVSLRLDVGTSEHVWALLEAHECDLVIAGRPPPVPGLVVRAVRPNTLVVVGSPETARGFAVPRATWLLREPGSGTRATCEALLAALDADPPALTLGSNGAVVAGAAAGLGVTLASRDAVRAELGAGGLVTLAVPHTPMRRPWHAVTHRHVPAATRLLLSHLLAAGGPAGQRWRPPGGRGASPAQSTGQEI
jgi:LysR family transcriptional regulator, low CO2-responsive transcriptional regulator